MNIKNTIFVLSFLILISISYVISTNFAIIHTDDEKSVNDVVQKITPLVGGDIDLFSAKDSTPTLCDLAGYDAILVYSNYVFDDSVALGNLLADFIDSGRGVVLANFGLVTDGPVYGYPRGRFVGSDNDYYVITPSSRDLGPELTLVRVESTHEILKGVKRFSGGTSSFRCTGEVVEGGSLVAVWSDCDKTPLIATRIVNGVRRVDLNFFPVSSDVAEGFWLATTDGAKIIANSIIWVSESDGARSNRTTKN